MNQFKSPHATCWVEVEKKYFVLINLLVRVEQMNTGGGGVEISEKKGTVELWDGGRNKGYKNDESRLSSYGISVVFNSLWVGKT